MDVSVVVIAYNEEATIGACIEAVCGQDYPKITEIIIVDGSSGDRTQEIARQWQDKDKRIRVITEDPKRPHKGPSEARRLGIEAASGEYALLLNGDVSIGRDYTSRLMEFVQNNNLSGAAGLRWCRDATFIEDFVNIRYWLSYQANPDEIQRPSYLSSDAALYRRPDLLSIGNFNPVLISHEDSDIGYRLTSNNKPLRYFPELIIFHNDAHYRTLLSYLIQRVWYAKGAAQLAQKYPFRYAAEQNKVNNFIIRPAGIAGLWFVLTSAAMCISRGLALVVQLWPMYVGLRLIGSGYKTYRLISRYATPTRIRPVCCWLWPVFDWVSYVVFTLSYMRYVEPPDALYKMWRKESMTCSGKILISAK